MHEACRHLTLVPWSLTIARKWPGLASHFFSPWVLGQRWTPLQHLPEDELVDGQSEDFRRHLAPDAVPFKLYSGMVVMP